MPPKMMTKTDASKPVQGDLFKVMLRDLVAPGHELVLLRDAIDWERFEKALEPAYCSDNGRPAIPVRMMAGLTFLKYMFGLSDQDVLDSWCENPYWQYFCGGEFFEHEPPTNQATMSRWRGRAGEAGVREMIMETLSSALRNKVARKGDFERVNVDTTVEEKNVRFPTDARTLDRARERVVATGKKLGVTFKRNYVRKGKSMLRKHSGYVKAKQYNRAANVVRAMKRYLKNVADEAEAAADGIAPTNAREMALLSQLRGYLDISRKLIAQGKDTPGKDRIYSVHEPQVECIAKGKVHKRYEFGVKAGYVTASKSNWVLGAMALPGNPYDGNTLARMLEQSEELSGVKPLHAYCDLGYRGHDYAGDCDVQVVNRYRRRKPRAVLRWWKRRSAIEPVIGHIKSDHYMGRNMLGGELGDKLNAMLAAVGFNLVKLMKGLKKRWLKRLFLCLRAVTDGMPRILAHVRDWFLLPSVAGQPPSVAATCGRQHYEKWGFA